MSATEELKTELEKICQEIEGKIQAKNVEFANILSKHKSEMDVVTGEARLDLLAVQNQIQKQKDAHASNILTFQKEIRDLEVRRDNLHRTIAADMAEVSAEKIRLAAWAERLKENETNLESDRQVLVDKIHDLARRENELRIALESLEQGKKDLESQLVTAQEIIAQAAKEKSEAALLTEQANALLKEANAKKESAEITANTLLEEANKKLVQAKELADAAEEEKAKATKAIADATAVKNEYLKKLEESQAWVAENSRVSDKLSSWEAALQSERERLQDDKAKLAIAEKAFATKNKGGNSNG